MVHAAPIEIPSDQPPVHLVLDPVLDEDIDAALAQLLTRYGVTPQTPTGDRPWRWLERDGPDLAGQAVHWARWELAPSHPALPVPRSSDRDGFLCEGTPAPDGVVTCDAVP